MHGGGIIASMRFSLQAVVQRCEALWADLFHFPWATTVATLRERFHEDRLGLTASSLTFTVFPIFDTLQGGLQRWLVESLVPETISRQVLGYLTQFAAQASSLGATGFSFLLVTALMLILTIDRTLNNIWRVRRLRPLGQRVFIYWAALTLGPLVLGASLALSSYVMSASRGVVQALPDSARLLFDSIEFFVLATGMAALFHYVPNTRVLWRHAWVGGFFVAIGIEGAKKILALYLSVVPTYSVLYGAFATLPILLVWMYVAWVIVLLGAVVTAYLPSLLAGVARRASGPGWKFQWAVEVLQHLAAARVDPARGLRVSELAQQLRVDVLTLTPVLVELVSLGWIALVSDPSEMAGLDAAPDPRYVLWVDPAATALEPLLRQLLLGRAPSLEPLWRQAPLATLTLADVLLKK